jgi:uncharacterized spore protein YtfJ
MNGLYGGIMMTSLVETLSEVETLQNQLNANLIYGEPIKLEDKVVLPVAKIATGFGGGRIEVGNVVNPKENYSEEGSRGAGGGIIAYPVGVFEITKENTRFISASNKLFWGMSVAAAFMLGSVFRIRRANG